MAKINRYISIEMILAILLIAAFFLPWLDWGILKKTGWDIPGFQKGITKTTNFFKFFSKNKEFEHTAYAVYIVPIFSVFVFLLWVWLKQKTARVLLFITGIIGIVLSINLFYSLPKAGNGVYLLCGTSIFAVVYLLFVFMRKKKAKNEELLDTPPDEEDITEPME